MAKELQMLLLQLSFVIPCFAQADGESSGLAKSDILGNSQEQGTSYREAPFDLSRSFGYHPEHWTSPPKGAYWYNPYPPSMWYSQPHYVPYTNPYPPGRWLPPPSGPQWQPPPPSYYLWKPNDFIMWTPVTPSELSKER